ncbi:hypothetical protein OH77DRAFT_1432556 [Trametes cingulata]|nr:hypothetical protein OH77DRAFT_1432556 [Trametes cingulata]
MLELAWLPSSSLLCSVLTGFRDRLAFSALSGRSLPGLMRRSPLPVSLALSRPLPPSSAIRAIVLHTQLSSASLVYWALIYHIVSCCAILQGCAGAVYISNCKPPRGNSPGGFCKAAGVTLWQ